MQLNIRKQILFEVKFLNKYIPGFENAYMSSIAPLMGIREGRHAIGEYVLTYEDIVKSKEFDDVVVKDRTIDRLKNSEKPFAYYQVPYRALLPKEIDNLFPH